MTLAEELATLRALARDLAACDPVALYDGSCAVPSCTLCGGGDEHTETCPWARARALAAGDRSEG